MVEFRRAALAAVLLTVATLAHAGNYLFISPPYLVATLDVVKDAREHAPAAFKGDAEMVKTMAVAADALEARVQDVRREQVFKKVKEDSITDREDVVFAEALNNFKDGLNAMSDAAGKKLQDLLPSWDRWNRMEINLVSQGLDQRLAAYRTRFGPDSEPINLVEYLASQTVLPGTEAGPSAWEPIARVSAVQATTRGTGLTSSVQLGMNHYFLNGRAPAPFRWIGLGNHVGIAAMLQYLDHPGILSVKGRPAFGVMFHLDRKEIGVSWDNAEDRLNLTVGYAFQFVPMVM